MAWLDAMPIQWQRWGLSFPWQYGRATFEAVCADPLYPHNLVASYLDNHPDRAWEYRTDQHSTVKYWDVLMLAQSECGQKPHYYDNASYTATREMELGWLKPAK